MKEVTNELIYNVLKIVQADVSVLKESVRRIDARMGAIRKSDGRISQYAQLAWARTR
jgi:hypothetical protein